MTYGGGPAGGYAIDKDGAIFEVDRQWFQVATVEQIDAGQKLIFREPDDSHFDFRCRLVDKDVPDEDDVPYFEFDGSYMWLLSLFSGFLFLFFFLDEVELAEVDDVTTTDDDDGDDE
jgi:hypothetical protein